MYRSVSTKPNQERAKLYAAKRVSANELLYGGQKRCPPHELWGVDTKYPRTLVQDYATSTQSYQLESLSELYLHLNTVSSIKTYKENSFVVNYPTFSLGFPSCLHLGKMSTTDFLPVLIMLLNLNPLQPFLQPQLPWRHKHEGYYCLMWRVMQTGSSILSDDGRLSTHLPHMATAVSHASWMGLYIRETSRLIC